MSTPHGPDHLGPHSADNTAHTPAAAAAAAEQASLPLAVVVLGVAVYLTHGILTMEVSASASAPGPKFFPIIVTVIAYIVGVLLVVQAVRAKRGLATAESGQVDGAGQAIKVEKEPGIDWRHVGIVVGVFIVFMVILEPVGWLTSAALLFAGVAFGLGSRNHLINIGAGLALSSIIQLAFSGGLGLPLPAGILGAF